MASDGSNDPNLTPSLARRQGALDAPVDDSQGTPAVRPGPAAGGRELCTTPYTARSCHDSAGADTVRFLFRVAEIAPHTFRSGKRSLDVASEGSGELLASGLLCGPVEIRDGQQAVWVEGRPDQIVNGRGHDELLPVDRLPEVDEVIRESLGRMGCDLLPTATEVGRIDTTASVELGSRSEMQAALRAVEVAPPPLRRVQTYRKRDGTLESVAFVGPSRPKVFERVYAEGPKHGAERARFIRFEAQNRFGARNRLPLSEWTEDRVSDTFARRFDLYRERLGSVTIDGLDDLANELARLHSDGQVSSTACGSLIGYLVQRRNDNHRGIWSDRTVRGYESELIRLGLSLDPKVETPVRLDLQALLDRMMSLSWASA